MDDRACTALLFALVIWVLGVASIVLYLTRPDDIPYISTIYQPRTGQYYTIACDSEKSVYYGHEAAAPPPKPRWPKKLDCSQPWMNRWMPSGGLYEISCTKDSYLSVETENTTAARDNMYLPALVPMFFRTSIENYFASCVGANGTPGKPQGGFCSIKPQQDQP